VLEETKNLTYLCKSGAVYQDIVNAYRTADRNEGKKLLRTVIDALTTNLPTELVELKRLDGL
jgi:transposase